MMERLMEKKDKNKIKKSNIVYIKKRIKDRFIPAEEESKIYNLRISKSKIVFEAVSEEVEKKAKEIFSMLGNRRTIKYGENFYAILKHDGAFSLTKEMIERIGYKDDTDWDFYYDHDKQEMVYMPEYNEYNKPKTETPEIVAKNEEIKTETATDEELF